MKTNDSFKTTFHRNGEVTIWNVYTQTWQRSRRISDDVLASLDASERARVLRHIAK
jgi:hypothetical protein